MKHPTLENFFLMAPDSNKGSSSPTTEDTSEPGFRINDPISLGGVAAGNGFHVNSDQQINDTLEAAWEAGVRYFDTAPLYGYGLSERRFGRFLFNKDRDDFILSTKVGRLLHPDPDFSADPDDIWKGQLNFETAFDYTAEGVRRSIEDSMHRMGLSSIDVVYIHDLSPDMMGKEWTEYFEIAREGAMPELTRMREEGIIKAWGIGVNTIEPILKTIETADPDIVLSATQYSLMNHQDSLERLFPACEKNDVSVVVGAAVNAGFLAGKDRFDYGGSIPEGLLKRRERIHAIADKYDVDLRTAALQFSFAPKAVTSVVTGASKPYQIVDNVSSMDTDIPSGFWKELKEEQLISSLAPEPGNE
ncbi:aldo/keto reductase [Aliifodinibius salicampi]|uniref:Aldo/keto reductase n=1 Tax=Fodinibius salicampi TaxID=1920655 RepID=A0ABT3Q2H8_9BACT|nr:aldo/keto reductase [Fodinibius salicampi]MCW9714324.1 aldo/keto reductase [Fodinibius salicampi]